MAALEVGTGVAVMVKGEVGVTEALPLPPPPPPPSPPPMGVGVGEMDGERLPRGEAEGDMLMEDERLAKGEAEGEREREGEAEGEGERLAIPDTLPAPDWDTDTVMEAVWEGDFVEEGEGV